MSKKSVTVEGRSLKKALKQASEQLGVPPEQVGHELISKTDAGIFSFIVGSRVEIKAWVLGSEPTKQVEDQNRGANQNRGGHHNQRGNQQQGRDQQGGGRDSYKKKNNQNRNNDNRGQSDQQGRNQGGRYQGGKHKQNEEDRNSQNQSRGGRGPRNDESSHEDRDEANMVPREIIPLTAEEKVQVTDDLQKFCSELVAKMTCRTQPVPVSLKFEEERLFVNVDDAEFAEMIKENMRIADAVEHLIRKKPRYLKRELPFRIFVDANGCRLDKEQELINMAKDLSKKVLKENKPIVLNYKSPYERKIIHMALDKDENVYTKSIGHGNHRKLMILPVKDDQRSSDAAL